MNAWSRKCLVPRCSHFFLLHRESVLHGWLLLNLLTGYFLPSNILMPYATKFLQLASSDTSSTHHGMTVSVSCKINVCPFVTRAQWSRKEDRNQAGTWSNGKIFLILLGRRNERSTEGAEPAGQSLLCISDLSVCRGYFPLHLHSGKVELCL